jgi:arylsulfatase A
MANTEQRDAGSPFRPSAIRGVAMTPRRVRIGVLAALGVALVVGCTRAGGEPAHVVSAAAASAADRPNIVLIFTDDMGYGDLSSYGHPTIRTPRLDRMAREGIRLTSFYVAAAVCTPSRAGLLTGRHAIRSGMSRVLVPASQTGLPQSEITLARALKERGYRTAAIGKWHLGHLPEFLPTAHGFDTYFGIPYSNDMDNVERGDPATIPLMRDTEVIEEDVDQSTITSRYTEEAIAFMREAARHGEPFFVYLAHTMPHLPLYVSEPFRGSSRAGLYGDVIEELDWSTGQVLDAVRDLGLDANTLVIFTSDNGPWLTFGERWVREYGSRLWHGGSAGHLRGAKSSTYEGGVRVPAIVRWPGVVPPGLESAEIATAMDLFPTLIGIAGGEVPTDRPLDGQDLMPLLTGQGSSPTREYFYFRTEILEGVREGRWKLRIASHFRSDVPAGAAPSAELFDLDVDPGERFNMADENPQVVQRLRQRMQAFAREVGATTEIP